MSGFSIPADVDLTGRVARCYCGAERPSSPSLAFFEYLGPGTNDRSCAHCGFYENVHVDTPPHILRQPSWKPHAWEQRVLEHDRFYCGCRGWD